MNISKEQILACLDFGLNPNFISADFLKSQGFSPSLPLRFIRKVDKNGPMPAHCHQLGPCWIWTGTADRYGWLSRGIDHQSGEMAHRISWLLHFGGLPEDQPVVLHWCDTPLCVRPGHLRTGTHADNVHDRVTKGRSCRGVNHRSHKLTETDIIKIRASRPQLPFAEIAKDYGVWPGTIWSICQHKTWRHV